MSSELRAEGTPPPSPAQAADMVAIGVIRRPVGLKGQCYVDAFGKTLPGLVPPVRLWGGSAPSKVREIALREMRSGPRGLVCKFEGFDDMDAAGALRGWICSAAARSCRPSRRGAIIISSSKGSRLSLRNPDAPSALCPRCRAIRRPTRWKLEKKTVQRSLFP